MATIRLLTSCLSPAVNCRRIFTKAVCQSPVVLQMPALSPTMVEGTITKWLVSEGDSVEIGDAMCEVETDKAIVTMDASEEGTLAKIVVPEGTKNIQINVPIAILAEVGEDVAEAAKFEIQSSNTSDSSVNVTATEHDPPITIEKPSFQRKQLSPAVRQTLQHYEITSHDVTGTGPKGLILKGDVLKHIQANNMQPKNFKSSKSAPSVQTTPPTSPTQVHRDIVKESKDYEDVELSNVRKVIAKRLVESKQQIPHAYASIQCTINKLLQLRKEFAKEGIKVSINDFIIKMVAHTLRQVPEANTVWRNNSVPEQSPTADVSVAVATDGGLITPIVKNASDKSIQEIGGEIRELAGRAREGRLKPEEFQGGSFTISNLGMFGIREFTAVINPPQTCIMAVGGTRSVISSSEINLDNNDDVVPMDCDVDNVITVTLSSDARVVDDVIAAKFLRKFQKSIENPGMMGWL